MDAALTKGANRKIFEAAVDGLLKEGVKTKDDALISYTLNNGAKPESILENYYNGRVSQENFLLALKKGLNATELMFAAINHGDFDALKIALDGGADVTAKKSGVPVCFFAIQQTHEDGYAHEKNRISLEIFDYLLDAGMNINATTDDKKDTALNNLLNQQTISKREYNQINTLLEKGANSSIENGEGVSALIAVHGIKKVGYDKFEDSYQKTKLVTALVLNADAKVKPPKTESGGEKKKGWFNFR